jgi:hypothetical protein
MWTWNRVVANGFKTLMEVSLGLLHSLLPEVNDLDLVT